MKTLIISEDNIFTSTLDSFFKEHNFSTIIYKWLIKAMDNLEEIKPEVIIISADEYPRHWKTLVQFMNSGIAGNEYKIYLFKKENFSDDDLSKISTLQIRNIFSDISESTLSTVFSDLFITNSDNEAPNNDFDSKPKTDDLVITNPGTHNFIFGKYFFKEKNILNFETSDFCSNLRVNDFINKITYSFDGKYVSTSAKIRTLQKEDNIYKLELELQE